MSRAPGATGAAPTAPWSRPGTSRRGRSPHEPRATHRQSAMTRGVVGIAGYVPYRRLQRAEVARVFGTGGGKGARAVASYDEDTTTMGVEAAPLALRAGPSAP